MTNEEIWKWQQEQRAHREAVPKAMEHVRGLLIDFDGSPVPDGQAPLDGITAGELRTLIKEVERLQAALKQANQDLRDEQREGQYAASAAYSEGRHEAMREAQG